MLPTTHYLYLAFGLFALGLGGATLRRSLVVVLLSVQLMVLAVALIFSAYARVHGALGGQSAAFLIVLVGLLELAVAAAIIVRAARAGGGAALLADWTAVTEEEPS